MSLNLDARQRAMLQEMGHPLWWPESPAPSAKTAAAAQPEAAAPAAPATTPAPAALAPVPPPLPQRSDGPGNPAVPQSAPAELPPAPAIVFTATAPASATPPPPQALPADFPRVRFALRAPVLLNLYEKQPPASPATQPAWLVVAELPEGAPQHGQASQLLVQMLRAMRLTDAPVYWVPLARIAANQEDEDGLPNYSIDALVQECQPAMALLLGLPAVRHLMPGDQAFSSLRQSLHHLGASQLPAVVSYDPSHLLRTPQAKAATWADLCFALAQAGR